MWLSTSTSTRSIEPTKPTSSALATGATSKSAPSSPESPTAGWPWRLSRWTMSELSLPSRTIFATSTVSASETRRPSMEADLEAEPLHVLG